LFRPRRRLLPGRWTVALALLVVGVLAGGYLALGPFFAPAPQPRGSAPPSAAFQRDLPAGVPPPPWSAPGSGGLVITGRAGIIDGDTIEVGGRRIRLHGIDAPEIDQICHRGGRPWRCGSDAAAALDRFIGGRRVACTELDVDRYGRSVAACTLDSQDVGDWMVRNGWAVAYRRFSEAYVGAEAEARAARRGIWSSRFEMPESHRSSRH
jgi:endonuclease YncB( thermonuclease family)